MEELKLQVNCMRSMQDCFRSLLEVAPKPIDVDFEGTSSETVEEYRKLLGIQDSLRALLGLDIAKRSLLAPLSSSTPVKQADADDACSNNDSTFEQGQNLSDFFQQQPAKETSYDRLPLKEIIEPSKVRGKARKQLPGYSCTQCENYYDIAGVQMEKCTRHRGQKRCKSPKGYWDVDFPSTQEVMKRIDAQSK